jgi:hypothetical protein
LTEASVPHVQLPTSFREDLHQLIQPIAASMRPRSALDMWAAWGVHLDAPRGALKSALATGTRPKRPVSFAEGPEAVGVRFFCVEEPPPAEVHGNTTHLKPFDGPSGHKMRRSVREGDEDDWDEISRLMAQPRASVCWSHTW